MRNDPSLILIRHAQSQNNALPEAQRIPDPALTEIGVIQSQKLASAVTRIRPSVLYCSPFQRSLQTAYWVSAETNIVPHIRQDLYEQGGCHSGHTSGNRIPEPGLGRSQLESNYPNWILDNRISQKGWFHLDHYETMEESKQRAERVRRWFESGLEHDVDNDRVAMVIHADFKLRLLETFLERNDLEDLLGDVINTSITQISKRGARWKLDYWNVFEHLEDELVTK